MIEQLRMLLATHHLLLVPGERTEAEHVRLISCFGRVVPQGPRVLVNDRPRGPFPTVTFVSNMADKGGLGTFELAFHHDLGHVPTPLAGLSLYGFDVVEGQSATRFANGRLAYLALSADLQQRLEGLQGLFTANYTVTTGKPASARDVRDHLDPTWPRAVHPVVVPHPLTGERCIYVNEMMTVSILGLPAEESDEILDTLFAALYEPTRVYEHQWRNHDLVIWDNTVVQHARREVGASLPRTLRRVVFGEKVPWEEWPSQAPSVNS
jgi:alpha-ketoglutarate-dependent taurine dioxygenase